MKKMMTILAAMAVVDTIENKFGLTAHIKWPNDVLVMHKKICGILTEHIKKAVIVGIGVNLRKGSYPIALANRAISIEEALEASDRLFPETQDAMKDDKGLIQNIWEAFMSLYQMLCKEQSLSFLMDSYNQKLINRNQIVQICEAGTSFEAKARGIDAAGRLVVLKKDTKECLSIDSGEVHVRGLYGYV